MYFEIKINSLLVLHVLVNDIKTNKWFSKIFSHLIKVSIVILTIMDFTINQNASNITRNSEKVEKQYFH